MASNYSAVKFRYTNGYYHDYVYVLVNEVLGSEKLQKKPQEFVYEDESEDKEPQDHDAEPDHPFVKQVYDEELQAAEEDYRKDALGRRYRNVDHDDESELDEFVADENIVIPRYLIKIKKY